MSSHLPGWPVTGRAPAPGRMPTQQGEGEVCLARSSTAAAATPHSAHPLHEGTCFIAFTTHGYDMHVCALFVCAAVYAVIVDMHTYVMAG